MVAQTAEWKPVEKPRAQTSEFDYIFGATKTAVADDLDLIARVSAFANGTTDIAPALATAAAGLLLGKREYPLEDDDEWDRKVSALAEGPEARLVIERNRQKVRQVLEAAATDLDQLLEWVNDFRTRRSGRMGMVRRPVISVDKRGRLQVGWSLDIDTDLGAPDSFSSALNYVAVLLLSDHQGCRRDLGYCRLPGCGKFFVVERGKPGKPRRDYCCDKHMLEAHAQNATERSRRARAKKKAAAAQSRRRRPS